MKLRTIKRRQAARTLDHVRLWSPDRFDVCYGPCDQDDWDDDQDDAHCWACGLLHDACECHVGDDCGRWRNGVLSGSCSKAGSEECDFECPYSR